VLAGVTSLYILGEFRSVLTRPKFGIPLTIAEALALEIAGFTEVMAVERAIGSWADDPGHGPVVETAHVSGATHIATGDQSPLPANVPGLRMVTVTDLLNLLRDGL